MPTLPYIHFQGQCAEALAFYAKVFGGTDIQTMKYSEAPGVPEAWKSAERVIHGQVRLGDGTLMASDFPPGVEGDPQKGFSVMQTAPDVPTARAYFDALADGGAIIDDFKPTFFSPGFGMVKDKFGTHWIISALPETPASG
jgi:PhnB protein